jgi:hypothetical protein
MMGARLVDQIPLWNVPGCLSGVSVLTTMLPGELAQASLFVAELNAEITQLRARVEAAEQRWQQRRLRSPNELEPPERLMRLRAQLDEATRVLATVKAGRRRRAQGRSGPEQ